jgi:cytoskeletal protein RodZ
MITGNQREFLFSDRSGVAFCTPVEPQRLGDKRISYSMLLWSSITMVVLTLTLSLIPSTTVYAQQSAADKPRDPKSQALRTRKTGRTQSKAKMSKGAKQNTRGGQKARSQEDQQNGKTGTNTTTSGIDEPESADSASNRREQGAARENGTNGLNAAETTERGVTSIATQRSNRMEFDARLVYGETAGSGAVILFERGQRHLPPLTKQRTKFLSATTEPVFGKKDESRYRVRDDSKEAKSNKTENDSTIDGLRN